MENNPQKRRRYQKDTAPTDDIVTLIHLVRQNPTLYNYKLQPNQRRRIDILNGWAQIAATIGNKYTVEECRRKWKNLRDTYHQYRLRKHKMSDGLSKWRYAKDMEFLSNVYQPKLKSNRTQIYNTTQDNLLNGVTESIAYKNDDHDQVVSQDMVQMVNDTDTFILTAYEDVSHDNDVSHEDPNMVSHSELSHDDNSMDDCVEIIKHEHHGLNDDDDDEDGNTGAEVDYEEVCLYEESGNTPNADCETIIAGGAVVSAGNSDDEGKYQYMSTNDFCISAINPTRSQYSSSASSVMGATLRLKSLPMVSSSTTSIPSTSSSNLDSATTCVTLSSPSVHFQTLPVLKGTTSLNTTTATTSSAIRPDSNSLLSSSCINSQQSPPPSINKPYSSSLSSSSATARNHQREECDLFFDFLKKKIQRFPREEITSIQVEFLNCVLRREAEQAQKNQQLQNNSMN